MSRQNILVIYGANATFTNTVMEHARAFGRHSRHNIRYASIAPRVPQVVLGGLRAFNVVVLHYSFFPGLGWKVDEKLQAALAGFRGLKILFLQDEYDHTDDARRWISALGVQCIYTCVPPGSLPQVYPPEQCPGVDFRQTLTGFVPQALPDIALRPPGGRPIAIGYRGRQLHPRYGDLAREKWLIGERMREICSRRGVPADIDSSEGSRIYGSGWYEFLANCRATLGTESGSNVLDADGALRAWIDAALVLNPDLSYEEIHAKFIGEREGEIRMNQVSPRIFEAAAMRTALILFEGGYSGVVAPWEHYLPLRKDFSNADELLDRLGDAAEIEAMTGRAYEHVIAGGKWSYQAFIREFDAYVDSRTGPGPARATGIESIAVPIGGAGEPIVAAVPEGPTDMPYQVEWLLPELRTPDPSEPIAATREIALDRVNAEFWNELCGTQMAKELGIADHNPESLARFDRAYLDFYPYLLDRVPAAAMRGKAVLEIGLGYGTLGQCIADAGADYTGLDIAALPVRMMEHRLKMRGLPGRAVKGSMLNCPFDDGSFDVVVSIGCFHHTGDIERCIRETYRVLRPGGRAYVMVYNKFSLRQWLQWPRTTARALARELLSAAPASGQEVQRRAYDANLSGNAAPETVFVSRAGLRSMFRQFSSVSIRSENSDPWSWRGRQVLRREAMLRLGWLWGLDLYVDAGK